MSVVGGHTGPAGVKVKSNGTDQFKEERDENLVLLVLQTRLRLLYL